MNGKDFMRLFFMIFNCKKLYSRTRYILCSIIEYQNIFSRDNFKFNLLFTKYWEMYNINYDELKYHLTYYQKKNWISMTEKNFGWEITINYNELENYIKDYLFREQLEKYQNLK